MFFESWISLLRVIVVGTCAYIALVLLLRVSGKRTLSKLNAFDLVITVALGSSFATVVLSRRTPLLNGIVAFALLVLLQFVVTWLSVRSSRFKRLVKSEPRMLLYRGEYLREAMKAERVTEDEVLSAMRQQQASSVEQVEAVVMETDASMTVLMRSEQPPTALSGVSNAPEHRQPE